VVANTRIPRRSSNKKVEINTRKTISRIERDDSKDSKLPQTSSIYTVKG
jgi:hypothetical protein